MRTKPLRHALNELLTQGHSAQTILAYVHDRLDGSHASRAKPSALDRLRQAGAKRNSLPDDVVSLRKIIKQNHPDTGTQVDTDLFCLAVNKLKQVKRK